MQLITIITILKITEKIILKWLTEKLAELSINARVQMLWNMTEKWVWIKNKKKKN